MNGVHDPDEKLINDNGNGDYDGPKEGQGNIYFGDRTQIWGGVTDGFMYAENNGYLVTNNTKKQVFGVRGFFSAGGILDMGSAGADVNRAVTRNGNRVYTAYRVQFDPRLANGTISLKGMPAAQGGGFAGLVVAAWREIQPNEWAPPSP